MGNGNSLGTVSVNPMKNILFHTPLRIYWEEKKRYIYLFHAQYQASSLSALDKRDGLEIYKYK